MAQKSKEALMLAINTLDEYDEAKINKVFELEDEVDEYEDRIGVVF